MELFLTILTSVLAIIAAVAAYYIHVKKKVTERAVELINNVEELDLVGEEKKELVVEELQKLIPAAFKPFLTKSILDALVQLLFDQIDSFVKKQNK